MPLTRIDSAFLDLDAIGGIDFDVNNSVPTFKVDATTHRVGIGHNSPETQLHMFGSYPTLKIQNSATAQYASASIDLQGPAGDERYTKILHGNSNTGGTETYFQIEQYDGSGAYVKQIAHYSYEYDYWAFSTGATGTEKLRITSDGKVGIGTNDPSHMLEIYGSVPAIELTDSDTGVIHRINGSSGAGIWYFDSDVNDIGSDGSYVFRHGGNTIIQFSPSGTLTLGINSGTIRRSGDIDTYINFTGSDEIKFVTANSEQLRIDGSGNVGIGTNNPADKLHVLGSATISSDTATAGSQYATLVIGERPAADSYASIEFKHNNNSISSKIDGRNGEFAVWSNWNSTDGDRFDITGSGTTEEVKLMPGNIEVISAEHNTSTGASATYFAGVAHFQRTDTANEGGDIRFSRAVDNAYHYSIDVYGNTTTNPRLRLVNVTASREDFTLTHAGNIGIGTNNPTKKLTVLGDDTELIRLAQAVDSGTQQEFGIGFAANISHTHPAAQITYKEFDASDSRGNLLFYTRGDNSDSAPTEKIRIASDGNVGIGTNNPIYPLHVQESAYFRRGIQVSVLASNELQSRSPINSGFYNVDNTTTADGWPFTGWHHLLANTHSNTTNYYSQQFASSFFNQELYFRNTNAGGTTTSQSWGQVMHTNSTLKPVYAESSGNTDPYSRYWYPGGEYYVSVHGITAPGDMDDFLEQGYYHVANNATNNPASMYGYLNVHRHQGSQYSLQHFIVSSDQGRQWMRASYPDATADDGRSWYQWYSYGALERENTFTNRQHLIGPSSTSTFTGLLANTNANRAQFVLHSAYSDLVISSAQTNNNHGSTLSFATSNPSDAADYNKFVINKGNYGTRTQFLEFGFKTSAHQNPHDYVNSTYTTLTLDGSNQRVGIGAAARTPAYPLDVRFSGDAGVNIKCDDSHASLYIDAASGNGGYIRFRQAGTDEFWITNDSSNNLNFRPNGGGTTIKFFNTGEADFYNNTQVYSKLLVQRNETTGVPNYTQGQIELRTTDNYTPAIGFHRSGYTASTIYESGGRLFINQNSGTDQEGRIVVSSTTYSENLYIRNGSPTIYLRDTNHQVSMLHCNSNLFYVLRGASDSTTWSHNSTGRWPLTVNLNNSDVTIGGNGYINGTTAITSDERLKTNIQSITGALEKVKALRGVTFYRTDINQDQLKSGLIAQEVEPIIPHIVDETIQQDPDTGEMLEDTRFKCVAYEELHPYLIEAIKEQQALIEALTARIEALENP